VEDGRPSPGIDWEVTIDRVAAAKYGIGVRELVSRIEQSIIGLLSSYGVQAVAKPEAPGVYVEGAKIASLGLRIRNGRSFHGLALNVDMNLEPFGRINPCGYAGMTMTQLAEAAGRTIPRLNPTSLEKLAAQARLQCRTLELRRISPDAPPCYEMLPQTGAHGEPVGLAVLPPADPADVFFDMEGYPLAPGGLEYLFGVCTVNAKAGTYEFYCPVDGHKAAGMKGTLTVS